MSFSG